MSDHFGISEALQAIAQVYFRGSRQSGRTTSLVESVKDGDRIVFASLKEAHRVERLCRDRGVKVDCVTLNPRDPQGVFNRPPSSGRTVFDHGWIEAFYTGLLATAAEDLERLQRETSGFGAAHRETRRKAEEIARWRP